MNKLNLTYYHGSDIYTDGTIEDEILEIVKSKKNILEILKSSNSWPILYHLSNIRENLLEWYDFDKNGTLLEIGSGCGALTGLFCRKVSKVVGIDLSKKRSEINAYKNSEYDNFEIMVGNFEDINLEEKFDYVTLIGVFEYSICYINSPDPFGDMLKKVKQYLKPNGKLIIAIENKFGLKYWAGASEDHVGKMFAGIENYCGVDRVRTFSKKSIENLLIDGGFSKNEFFYPVPDYKLPQLVYSESYLPKKGDLRNIQNVYDRDRMELFNEELTFDSLCEDGMFEEFSNSFLIISEV